MTSTEGCWGFNQKRISTKVSESYVIEAVIYGVPAGVFLSGRAIPPETENKLAVASPQQRISWSTD